MLNIIFSIIIQPESEFVFSLITGIISSANIFSIQLIESIKSSSCVFTELSSMKMSVVVSMSAVNSVRFSSFSLANSGSLKKLS